MSCTCVASLTFSDVLYFCTFLVVQQVDCELSTPFLGRYQFLRSDAGQGSITVPGSVSATPVEGPIDIEEGMPIDLPLVFYFGHQTPTDNPELYRAIVEQISSILDKRVRTSRQVYANIWTVLDSVIQR